MFALGATAFAGASYYSFANTSVKADDKVPHTGIPGTRFERTFIAIKPDGVQRGIVGEIIQRFEKKGYKLVGLKVVKPTKQFAEQHYADLSKKPFFPSLVNYFSSGPVVAMVWEGRNAIVNGRKIVGATNPADAEAGSVRGDLCIDIGRNIIHGSDGPESAKDEISLWFKEGEVASWESENAKWVYEKL
jgi:nucleoside-diphosphate kinase